MAAVFAKSAVAMALSKVWQSRLRHRYCKWKKETLFNHHTKQHVYFINTFWNFQILTRFLTRNVCRGSNVRPSRVVFDVRHLSNVPALLFMWVKKQINVCFRKQIYPYTRTFFASHLTRAGAVTGHFLFGQHFLTKTTAHMSGKQIHSARKKSRQNDVFTPLNLKFFLFPSFQISIAKTRRENCICNGIGSFSLIQVIINVTVVQLM